MGGGIVSDTTAMPLDLLNQVNHGSGQPLCPACNGGRLHPYHVTFGTGVVPGQGWQGADYLTGFVAVCRGSADRAGPVIEPCGFSMPLTSGRHGVGQ